jgi:hypothetical protein
LQSLSRSHGFVFYLPTEVEASDPNGGYTVAASFVRRSEYGLAPAWGAIYGACRLLASLVWRLQRLATAVSVFIAALLFMAMEIYSGGRTKISANLMT